MSIFVLVIQMPTKKNIAWIVKHAEEEEYKIYLWLETAESAIKWTEGHNSLNFIHYRESKQLMFCYAVRY